MNFIKNEQNITNQELTDIIDACEKKFSIIKQEVREGNISLRVRVSPIRASLKKNVDITKTGPLFEQITGIEELGKKLEQYEEADLYIAIEYFLPKLKEYAKTNNNLLNQWLGIIDNEGLGFYRFFLKKEPSYLKNDSYEQTISISGVFPFYRLFNLLKDYAIVDDYLDNLLFGGLLTNGLGTRLELETISKLEKAIGDNTVINHDASISSERERQLKRIVNAFGLNEDFYNGPKQITLYRAMLTNYLMEKDPYFLLKKQNF